MLTWINVGYETFSRLTDGLAGSPGTRSAVPGRKGNRTDAPAPVSDPGTWVSRRREKNMIVLSLAPLVVACRGHLAHGRPRAAAAVRTAGVSAGGLASR